MDLEMILNELSLKTLATDIPTARQWMSEFVLTMRQATTKGVKRVFRTHIDINSVELPPAYPIARWRSDQVVDLEEQRFFKTLITKVFSWTDLAEELQDDCNLFQVLYQGEEAPGLGFALISDFIALSIKSHTQWDFSYLELEVKRLDENAELVEEGVDIIHASCREDIDEHQAWIIERARIEIDNGVELWNRRQELFPNLIFCECVNEQIQSLSKGNPMLRQVVKKLEELEKYSANWKKILLIVMIFLAKQLQKVTLDLINSDNS